MEYPALFGATKVEWVSVAVFFICLGVVFVTDLKRRIILDEVSVGGLVIGLIVAHWTIGLRTALQGALLGGVFLWLVALWYKRVRGREGVGGGDIKLAAMLGAFLGPGPLTLTVFVASAVGSVVGLGLVLARRRALTDALPFGCFLAPAAGVVHVWGPAIIRWWLG